MNQRNTLVDIQVWLGYDRLYTVDPVNTAGGLAFFLEKTVYSYLVCKQKYFGCTNII